MNCSSARNGSAILRVLADVEMKIDMRTGLVLRVALAMVLSGAAAYAQSTIFVSRHADRFGTEPDPSLTPLGLKQAEALSRMLASAGVRHVYTTELLRARQTAAPMAKAAGVTPVIVRQEELEELIRRVRETAVPGESTLVIGHRQTVPQIVKALTGKDIPPLGSDEYGRLVVVTLLPDGRSSIVTLHYEE